MSSALVDYISSYKKKLNYKVDINPSNLALVDPNSRSSTIIPETLLNGVNKSDKQNDDSEYKQKHSIDGYLDFMKKLLLNGDSQIAHEIIDNNLHKLYKSYICDDMAIQNTLKFLPSIYGNNQSLMNTYFDKIYVLNLDRRPDRMEAMERNFAKWNIYNWVRFPAVDGSLSPHYEEWKHYSKQRLTRLEKMKYHRKAIGSYGSWGILKSMFNLLTDAKNKGYKRILVLQDDLLYHKSFEKEFVKIPTYIPDTWKLLYLGATQHIWTSVLSSKNFYHPNGTADGAFAVGIDKSIYQNLLDEIIKFDMPVDSGALRTLQSQYPYDSYVIYPNLIIADIRDSDLRQSRDLVAYGRKFKWDIHLYDIDSNPIATNHHKHRK
jgi:hypothetical protein